MFVLFQIVISREPKREMVKLSKRKRRGNSKNNNNVDEYSEHEYQVETIVDKRIRGKKIQYLLKWQGYSSADNTVRVPTKTNVISHLE